MKKNLSHSLLFLFFFLLTVDHAIAQFEGQVQYQIVNTDEGESEQTNLNMVFTAERIFIGSSSSLEVMSGLSTDGILVRNDEQDFVFNTGEGEAFKIAKYDIDRLVDLMNRVSGRSGNTPKQGFDWEKNVEETGRSRQIQGYTVNEFLLKNESDNRRVSVWLTDQIKVRWGLLNDAWQTTGRNQLDEDLPVELIMNPNSFPLLIEGYAGNKKIFSAEAVTVNTSGFDRSLTELSPNVKLLGLSDLMMSMFRQRR
ncbi:hypothetical protein [Rhodohalobacter halophilus]|uniref:hypothetical protein n=1 Tax=Rhodohalobacter halophilus TaxID=1812810 RepID=UPI00083F9D43|nr:hypothetical protein [Rhodohalobacter halophilus]